MFRQFLYYINHIIVFLFVFSIFNDGFLTEKFGSYALKIIAMIFLLFNTHTIIKNIKSMNSLQDKIFFMFVTLLTILFLIRSLIIMPDDLIKPFFSIISMIVIVIYFSRYPLERLLYFIWISMMISIIICYFNEPEVEWSFRKSGGALDPNEFSAGVLSFIFTAIYLFNINKNKFFLLISSILFFYGLFNGGSKSAFLALGVILLLITFKFLIYDFKNIFNYKFILLSSILLIAAIQIDFTKIEAVSNMLGRAQSMETADQRFTSWKAGQHMIEDHLIVGVGIKEFSHYTHKYVAGTHTASAAHNTYIQLLAESGIFVFILFMGLLLIVLIQHFNIIIHSDVFLIYLSLVSILLMGMTIGLTYHKLLWLYIAIVMNIHYAIRSKKTV